MTGLLTERDALRDRTEAPAEAISELYHENTKLTSVLGPNVRLPGETSVDELAVVTRGWKAYRLHPQVALPRPEEQPPAAASFDDVVAARRTVRDFADADVEPGELAKILHQTYGVTGGIPYAGGGVHGLRAAPSAGAVYPAELYLGIRRVRGVAPGLYHYEVPDHALALLDAGDPAQRLYDVCCYHECARTASVVVLIAACLQRTKHRYGERGYRYVLLDVGHLAQNLLLASSALGLGAMTTCGFFDDAANDLLRLDGLDEAVLYVAFLGRPGHGPSTGLEVL
jgi:SagB-type dehydrogenase family enzyme